MPRQRLCKVCGGWHELDAWPSECVKETPDRRSHLSGPMLIRDEMDRPLQSMADGKYYTSKSAMRAEYKARGFTEVGDDKAYTNPKPKKAPKVDRKAIRDSVDKAFSQAGLGA